MLRVALLGSAEALAASAPTETAGLLPQVIQGDRTRDQLRDLGCDAAVAFAPTPNQRAELNAIELPTLIWPREDDEAATAHPAQRIVATADRPGVWRAVLPPVSDRYFAAPAPAVPGRAALLGGPSPRRALYLASYGHSIELVAETSEVTVAVNLHDEPGPACEPRAASALAQGRLLVSEPLAPSRGLEPGIDFVEARDMDDLFVAVETAAHSPGAYGRIRMRGRRKAELFRSSRVVARLVGDLLLELGTDPSGNDRPTQARLAEVGGQ